MVKGEKEGIISFACKMFITVAVPTGGLIDFRVSHFE